MLSTATLVGALTGYARSAYPQAIGGACTGAMGIYQCSGTYSVPQSITAPNAQVTVVAPGLIVDTSLGILGDALTITGDGALSFTDPYSFPDSLLQAAGGDAALVITATGDDVGTATPGSITIDANGVIFGGRAGIEATNNGSGAIDITANGNVSASQVGSYGIHAINSGTDLAVTTGSGANVSGEYFGIRADNTAGDGALTIDVNGDVTSGAHVAIEARNGDLNVGTGTTLSVTTAAGTYVYGYNSGIVAINSGSGELTVTANSNVEGGTDHGIYANNAGTNLTITTGASASGVKGGAYGILASSGAGVLTITANGDVEATTGDSIRAQGYGTNVNVMTAMGTVVAGGEDGIDASNQGNGMLEVTANGLVTGQYNGINAYNSGTSTSLTVTVGANGIVRGYGYYGVAARNNGSGPLTINANGTVGSYGLYDGIYARDLGAGDLVVNVGASGEVRSDYRYGINAGNAGGGALTITVNGNVISEGVDAIYAENSGATTNLTVNTTAGSDVYGYRNGINARNDGMGVLSIVANGDVQGGTATGIYARNEGTNLAVTTGPSMNGVTGYDFGVLARNNGTGTTTVTANGDVTGTNETGIFAQAYAPSLGDLRVTTAANTTVTGNYFGVDTLNYGQGALEVVANGDVMATGSGAGSIGIFAQNGTNVLGAGTNLTVMTGAVSNVTGDAGIDARNYGSGALGVMANGNVTGNLFTGILAINNPSGTSLDITAGVGSNITGDDGIGAFNSGSGDLNITVNGDVEGITGQGIRANNDAGSSLSVITGQGSSVTGDDDGIQAGHNGNGALNITVNGNVTGTDGDGIDTEHAGGGTTNINIRDTGVVTSTGLGSAFAIDIAEGATNVTVAGTLNGGAGGAIRFDDTNPVDDRLELHPTGVVNGTVFAGPGDDTLALGGTGAGTFNLTNIDTGAGTQQYQNFETFEVVSGDWNFNGATTVPFTVNGGVVMGTGTFGDLTFNGGILAPGNSIGTMTVNGAFTLGKGAVYEVEINAQGQSDKVIVNGTVNLTGSILRVLAANGTYKPNTSYTIVENDGSDAVKGKFAQVTSNLAFLDPTVAYNGGTGNDVVLTVLRTGPGPGPGPVSFCSVAVTKNQCNVALALDQFPTNNALFLAVLNQTVEGARTAFDALSGEIHATVAGTLADDSRYVREAILGRMMQANATGTGDMQVASLAAAGPQVASLDASAMTLGADKSLGAAPAPSGQPLAFWTRAYGAWGDFDGNGNAATADRDLGGFVSGMDATLGGSWRIGLATGASFSNIDVNDRFSSADVESFLLAGYTGGMAGAFALRGGGAWAWNDIDTSRAVIFPGFFERQNASYDADTGQIFGEVAYPTQMGGIALDPFAGLAYVAIDTDSFREHGGALASLRGSADQDVGYSTLGLRAATTMHWGAMLVVPHVSAAWQHAFDDLTPDAGLAFATTGIGFTVYGVPLAEDSALIDAGLDFALGERTTAGVSYAGQFGEGVTDNAVKGRFTWLF